MAFPYLFIPTNVLAIESKPTPITFSIHPFDCSRTKSIDFSTIDLKSSASCSEVPSFLLITVCGIDTENSGNIFPSRSKKEVLTDEVPISTTINDSFIFL